MKNKLTSGLPLAIAALLLLAPACSQHQATGSVSRESVTEMLASPRMAVTLAMPGWLLEGEQDSVSPLSAAEITALRGILKPDLVRKVPEKYYRSASAGNRGDASDMTFYLYASNAQCLGGRVVGDVHKDWTVKMDDFNLDAAQEAELKKILTPHLTKLKILNP